MINIKKNDILTVVIEDMSDDGSGIGKLYDEALSSDTSGDEPGRRRGFTLFIKDTVIGDVCEVKVIKLKKHYGYGRLMRIIKESDHRIKARCPVARQCGGCRLQHMDYKAQLNFKENRVRQLLARVGGAHEYRMLPIVGMEEPWNYRNKAQYPVGCDREGNIISGFYAGRTHDVIQTDVCYIQRKVSDEVKAAVINWMSECSIAPYDEKSDKGLVRHILVRSGYHTGEVMVCIVINSRTFPNKDELVEALITIPGMTSIFYSPNLEKTNVILGDKAVRIWGKKFINDKIGDITYNISPLSFYQVNPVQTERLYEAALRAADPGPEDVIWDLYCGIGTISLFLAKCAGQVYGVEIVPQAIKDAEENARINGIENVKFYAGKAEEILPEKHRKENVSADIIVVDPPRKGCDESLLDCIISIRPKKVVYVSCNPATLARDVKILSEGGYKLVQAQCFDMFPHTTGIETCCLLII